MENFVADMDLMFNNAQEYNADESQIFQDAVTLQVSFCSSLLTNSKNWLKSRRRNVVRMIQNISIEV